MSKILYGVSGEGSGHSSRAREMGRHLLERGHALKMVSYDRGHASLSHDFDCLRIAGLHIVSVENKVRYLPTLWHNLRRLPAAVSTWRALGALFDQFRPDCVITDFEPATAWMARQRGIPLISLDNQHRMRYMAYQAPENMQREQWLTERIIRLMIPAPDVALTTTFFRGAVRNDRTFLYPPILRRELRELTPSNEGFHLVYLTSSYDGLMGMLAQFPDQRFIVYGQGGEGREGREGREVSTGNIHYKPFSSEGFLADLAACSSVIATAGFTLISEAMFLQKPYLALPLQGQFEQQLNAVCLAELGFGMHAERGSPEVIAGFLGQLQTFRERLSHYEYGHGRNPAAGNNSEILGKLDDLLADGQSALRQFQWRRRGNSD